MKIVITVFRILVGILFIFSGFVKGVDPWGSAYKFADYFEAFHMSWLMGGAFAFGLFLNFAEFVLGVFLLLNIRIKPAVYGSFLFMCFFTILTLILAIFNPVTDCGCFGDAIKMTNWETFWKNVIIMIPVVVLFKKRHSLKTKLHYRVQNRLAITTVLAFTLLTVHCYRHLPIIDFRPYKIGNSIKENMEIPEDAPQDEYSTELIYEKNGEKKTFTMENLPDSTWNFVDSKSTLIKKGYEPPIHDFVITNNEGEDLTEDILNFEGKTIFIVTYDLNKAKTSHFGLINELYTKADNNGYKFYGLTASVSELTNTFISKHRIKFPYYNMDPIQLKTMVRANPGIVMLEGDKIIGKWHFSDIEKIIIK